MCLATVYVEADGQQKLVMRDVAWIEPADGGLMLTTMLGETRLVQAEIESIDLMSSTIVLQETVADLETVPADRQQDAAAD